MASRATILVCEDDAAVRELARFVLEGARFDVIEAETVKQARQMLGESEPAVLLLDWMLPGTSGLEFARELKRGAAAVALPIIMLTAKGEEDDIIHGLESGADDYIIKPFSPRELVARIKALIRRTSPLNGADRIVHDGLELDPELISVCMHGETVNCGPTEFRLLHHFMAYPERVFSRASLLDRVWGTNAYIEERTVDVYVRRLRKLLKRGGFEDRLRTVRSAGYRYTQKPERPTPEF